MSDTKYLISEAAKQAGVESHVLRYWEEELQLPIARNEMGHRYYTKQDIQVFLSIKELKKRGFQLKSIKELVPKLEETVYLNTETSGDSGGISGVQKKQENIQKNMQQSIQKNSQQGIQKNHNNSRDRHKRIDIQNQKSLQEQPKKQDIPEKKNFQEQPKKQNISEPKSIKDQPKVQEQQLQKVQEDHHKEFYQILERLFQQASRTNHPEDRYKRLDAAIRKHQYSRRLVAATEEEGKKRKKKYAKPR